MKKIIFAGNVPYLAAVMLAASAFYVGLETSNLIDKPAPKIAFAEKGAVIMSTVLARQDISPDVLIEQVKKPILAVIKLYVDQGYVVIDSSRDENGNMSVNGIPAGAIDITPEIKAAVNNQSAGKTAAPAPTKASL